jgi:hypothetical protein
MGEKYISFEPWWGGFSNVKISYELIGAISIITDRIIILPPAVHCHFLNSAWNKKSYLNILQLSNLLEANFPIKLFINKILINFFFFVKAKHMIRLNNFGIKIISDSYKIEGLYLSSTL